VAVFLRDGIDQVLQQVSALSRRLCDPYLKDAVLDGHVGLGSRGGPKFPRKGFWDTYSEAVPPFQELDFHG
jgi:hypothetical protein